TEKGDAGGAGGRMGADPQGWGNAWADFPTIRWQGGRGAGPPAARRGAGRDFRIASADRCQRHPAGLRGRETSHRLRSADASLLLPCYLRSPKCARQKLSSASGSVLAKAELMNWPRYWPLLSA